MKKLACFVSVILFLVTSCVPATEPSETEAAVNTILPAPTSTRTPLPTATMSPSATPEIPTASITPMSIAPVSMSPLALNEFNAGTEMKRLNVIGTGTAHDIEFSPDGKQLAIATGRGIYLYDGTTFKQNGFIDVTDSVSAIAFSPDGNTLAVAVDGKVSLWNVLSGQQIMNLGGELISIYKLVYGLGGYVAALGGTCRGCGSPQIGVILWDAKTGAQIFAERDIWHSTIALTFSSDGAQLFFGGEGISVIETKTGKRIAWYSSGESLISAAIDAPYDFIFNKDSAKLLVTSLEERSEVFDIATQGRTPFPLCQINLTSNGEFGACSQEQEILIFDLTSGEELQSIDLDISAPALGNMFVLSPDSRFIVYYGRTGINIINIKTKEKVSEIRLTDFGIAEVGIIEVDGTQKYAIATLTYSGQVEIYDIQTSELIRTIKLNCCEVNGFNFAPDQKTFATIDTKNLRLWDLQTGLIIYEKDLSDNFSGPISFSPDGSSIFLTQIPEGYVLELRLLTGETINQGGNSYAYSFADPFAVENYHFNARGNLVILGFENNNEIYYPLFEDVFSKEKVILPVEIKTDADYIEAFSFSSDGQYVAFGNPTDIYVWNIETLKQQSELTGHEWRGADGWFGKIKDMIFSPQSNLLVSVGWDGTIRLWSARFGNELRRLNVCCSVDFTPDGRYLITYGNGVAYIWGIPE